MPRPYKGLRGFSVVADIIRPLCCLGVRATERATNSRPYIFNKRTASKTLPRKRAGATGAVHGECTGAFAHRRCAPAVFDAAPNK